MRITTTTTSTSTSTSAASTVVVTILLLSTWSQRLGNADAFFVPLKIIGPTRTSTRTASTTATSLFYKQDGANNNNNNDDDAAAAAAAVVSSTPTAAADSLVSPLSFITSPVLKQLYPELIQYKQEYGHPNIPLGTGAGRQCHTIRRLHIQQKLSEPEMAWLTDIGFTFHSLEEVYKFGNFETLYQRLMDYEAVAPPEERQYQIPKKCRTDPELGAWVTGIRRLGPDEIQTLNPSHFDKLNQINFTWISNRKCGSKFMDQYRQYEQQIMIQLQQEQQSNNDDNSGDDILQVLLQNDPKMVKWVQAQQEAMKRGTLSQTRIHYMETLFGGASWTQIGNNNGNDNNGSG